MENAKKKRWLQFLVGGGFNTALTYAVYLILNNFFNYQAAYFIAYIVGIVFSYLFNSIIVFKTGLSWRSFFAYPIVYLVQYGSAALILGGLVEWSLMNEKLAPLIVTVFMVPVTYLMSKFVLEFSTGFASNSGKKD